MKTNKTTKGRVTLYVEWDLEPSWKNRIEMEKILAMTCHKLKEENLLSWSDVPVKNYNYRIDLNLRNTYKNNKSTNHHKGKKNEHK